MSVDQIRTDELVPGNVPFGRSRALKVIGAALFGFALRISAPQLAEAAHFPVPYPCSSYGQCHCCSGSTCCEAGCTWDGISHCTSGGQCWYTCIPTTGDVYQCCDWHTQEPAGAHCICSTLTQILC